MATSADATIPVANTAAPDTDWRDYFGSALADGVCANVLQELLVIGDSTGRHVKVQPGRVRINGESGRFNTQNQINLATNTSGNPRIDRIVMRLVTTGTEHIELDVLQGTPGATPSPPALTYNSTTMEISLAQVQLANNYTTVPAQSTFPTAPVAGAPVGERALLGVEGDATYDSVAARDLWLPSPVAGMQAATRDKGARYFYDGVLWKQTLRHAIHMTYTPSGNEDTGVNATWPVGNTVSVAVPKWATRFKGHALIRGVSPVTGSTANVGVSLMVGSVTVDSERIRWNVDPGFSAVATANATDLATSENLANALKTALNAVINSDTWIGPGNKRTIALAGDVDVTSLAGTTVNVNTLGNVVSGSTAIRADANSSAVIVGEFL